MPVLDGTNYQQWAAQMQSHLMAQGQWKAVKEDEPNPTTTTIGTGAAVTTGDNSSEIATFKELNSKALGNIHLRLNYNIGYQYNTQESAKTLWATLLSKYRQPGLPKAFLEFKSAMQTNIPHNGDPSHALDKILTHFIRLKKFECEIPDKIQKMMLLAKAPPSMEVVTQALCADETKLETITAADLVKVMLQSYKTHSHQGGRNNQQQVNKLSAVKQVNGPPQFQQQQQQQRGEDGQRGQGGKRTRRGKRGGANQQSAPAQTTVQDLLQQLSQIQQQPPQPGPSTLQFTLDTSPPPHPFLLLLPTPCSLPLFNRALDLTRALGVKPTTEVLKRLEMAELGKDQRPNKRPHVQLPQRVEVT